MSRLARTPVFLLLALWASAVSADDAEEFFERQVRPVLAANCFSCHGEKEQESGLRLDSRAAILQGGDGGPVVVPGEAAHSRLLEAIRWTGELKMPPETQLRDNEIAALTRWVEMGLPWPQRSAKTGPRSAWQDHWAFQPVRQPSLPPVADAQWVRTPLDRFILAELDKQQLSPASSADRRTLIRRVCFDLWGVPPDADEVERFVNDPAVDAYEQLVDRVLASPQYGERWGRLWLDVARYADTKGYVFFEEKKYPWAYAYRDYVVRAWNADVPYDRFVMEQLAADQLENQGDRQRLTALGFITVGSHFMNNTHDIVDDRIDVVTRGLLGMTLTCSRCHDHKYDPLTMADYYALYGVFRSCYEPIVPPLFESPPADEVYEHFAQEMAKREKNLVDFVQQKHHELVQDARTRAGGYLWSAYQHRDHPPMDDFMLLVDKGDLNPTMVLRWQVYLQRVSQMQHAVWSPWHALAELSPESFASAAASKLDSLWGNPTVSEQSGDRPRINRLVQEALRDKPLASMQEVADRYGALFKSVDEQWRAIVEKAQEAGEPAPAGLADSDAEELRQEIYARGTPPDVPLAMDWGFLSLFPDRPTQGEYEKLLKEVEQWMMTGQGAPPRAMVLLDSDRPHDPRIFLRGNPHRLGDSVPRRFISVLAQDTQPFQQGSGRLELARAIVDPANPLTARVLVNRIWLHHFGQGLVRTPSDFGFRSEPPSHPELLDWLASDFVRNDWSIKWLQRQILLSAVYRQASEPTASGAQVDPENRWLSYFPRRRLDFESLRDALLSVSDSLEAKIGGPPVDLLGDAVMGRRTIYGTLDRMDVPPLLTTFDFPNPLTTSPQRETTTIAPQALYMMNSPFVAEIARRLVARPEVASQGDASARVTRLFQICYGRWPTEEERTGLLDYLGPEPGDRRWQQLGHALLMTNEFAFVE